MAIIFLVGLVVIIFGLGICIGVFIGKKNKKNISNEKTNKERKRLFTIIGSILLIIILLIIISKVFNIGFSNNENERRAICSNNSNQIIEISGSSSKAFINETSYSNNSLTMEKQCNLTKEIVYSYDKNGSVSCDNKTIISSYNRKESFDNVINDYNDNYKCIIYEDNNENIYKNKIYGSWCGLNFDNTNKQFSFYENGRYEEIIYGTTYEGNYEIKDKTISVGLSLTSDYYSILRDEFYYDNDTDTIRHFNKFKDDKFNVFKRCD